MCDTQSHFRQIIQASSWPVFTGLLNYATRLVAVYWKEWNEMRCRTSFQSEGGSDGYVYMRTEANKREYTTMCLAQIDKASADVALLNPKYYSQAEVCCSSSSFWCILEDYSTTTSMAHWRRRGEWDTWNLLRHKMERRMKIDSGPNLQITTYIRPTY